MEAHDVILFTDLVESTRLTERLGDAAAAVFWEKHDRAARDLLRTWEGQEVDRSDGFMLVFREVDAAVRFALAWHRALRDIDPSLRTRVGIHIGPLITRYNPQEDVALGAKPTQFEGIAKSTTARIMALAVGGQTLLSRAAHERLGSVRWRIEDHGYWRLKGLAEPMQLFEVGDADAPFTPPRDAEKAYRVVQVEAEWQPARAIPNNLPAERNEFVGRRIALAEIEARFDAGARLVSLLGIGGLGKTRVALRYARGWLGDYPGGVWFCDLAAVRDAAGIRSAVAQALDVPLGGADPEGQLSAAIDGRGACLLILDNFEQVTRHAEETIGRWMNEAAQVRCLVTSREVLGVPGEQGIILGPMSPDEAIRLFELRAAAVAGHERFARSEAASVPALVELLDRLPLAIELAAARSPVLSPRMLLERMSDRFRLLASSGKRRDRQATLRATLDWSWELLTGTEQSMLAQLSVFEGSFGLAAVEAVVELPEGGAAWPLDVLQSLVQKSLVRRTADGRFDLLRSVQDYAADCLKRLAAAPDAPPVLLDAQQRHWSYYASFAEAQPHECLAELPNLTVACRRAALGRDARASVASLLGAWRALRRSGPFSAVVPLIEDIETLESLSDAGLPIEERQRFLWIFGRAHHLLGHQKSARAAFDAALALAEAGAPAAWRAQLLCASGEQLTTTAELERAQAELEQALALAEEAGRGDLIEEVLNALGALAMTQGQIDAARRSYERALALCTASGNADMQGGLLGNLGELAMSEGKTGEARAAFDRALLLLSGSGHRPWLGNVRCNLGLLCYEEGDHETARAHFEAALQVARDIGYVLLEATVLCNLGILFESAAEFARALECHERAVQLATALGDLRAEGQFRSYLGGALAKAGRTAEALVCLVQGESPLRQSKDAVSLALLLCHRAEVRTTLGDRDGARSDLVEAAELARTSGIQPNAELRAALERAGAGLAGAPSA